jgi:hypothetical protein
MGFGQITGDISRNRKQGYDERYCGMSRFGGGKKASHCDLAARISKRKQRGALGSCALAWAEATSRQA